MKMKILGIFVMMLVMSASLSLAAFLNNPPVIEDCHYDLTSNTLWCTPYDQDGDQIKVGVDWDSDDGIIEKWTVFRDSGEAHSIYPVPAGCHQFSVKVQDEHGAESDWVTVHSKSKQFDIQLLLIEFLQEHTNLFPILRFLIGL